MNPRPLGYSAVCITLMAGALFHKSPCAFSCPRASSLVDFNCDRHFKIAITGDSIVRGIGDTDDVNEGYVQRLREYLPKAEVANLGVPGITSGRLYSAFKRLLRNPEGETSLKSKDVDLFIVQVGPNDYWKKEEPSLTVRNIRRLVKLLNSKLGKDVQTPPLFVIATLLPTKREYQAPFIAEINYELLRQSSDSFQVKIRFDKIPADLLSWDGLHPSAEGYDAMGALVMRFIRNDYQKLAKKTRKDGDHDGIYDYFELNRYFTDPLTVDTDGDGLSDGTEVFKTYSDPLDPTSVLGPTPTPTVTPTVTPTPKL